MTNLTEKTIAELVAEVKKWRLIATALVEANYERDGIQMNHAVAAYEEAWVTINDD
jgi:hypothetical protein